MGQRRVVGAGLDPREVPPPDWPLRQGVLRRCLSAALAPFASGTATFASSTATCAWRAATFTSGLATLASGTAAVASGRAPLCAPRLPMPRDVPSRRHPQRYKPGGADRWASVPVPEGLRPEKLLGARPATAAIVQQRLCGRLGPDGQPPVVHVRLVLRRSKRLQRRDSDVDAPPGRQPTALFVPCVRQHGAPP